LGQRIGSLYDLNNGSAIRDTKQRVEANLGLMTNQSPSTTLEVWHKRLCHQTLDEASVKYIGSKVQNMVVTDSAEPSTTICGLCAIGRQYKEAGTKAREKATEILAVMHCDLCGPMETVGLNGERYFVTFIDETSGRVSSILLGSKDGALTAFKDYRARAEKNGGQELRALRSNGGGEYRNREFEKFPIEAGIQHIVSPPYTPSQNGLTELMNRTIMENARCILEDSHLGKEFWGYAVLTAANIHNRLPSHSHSNISPLEHWTGKQPEIGHLRVFGATTWVHVPSEKRQKLDPKSVRYLFVGYEEDAGTQVYRLYNPENSKILVSRDVIIDESSVIGNPGDHSSTTKIEWEKESAPEEPKEGETNYEDFQPLDSIIPPAGVADNATEMQDSITLRPRSTGTHITGREDNSSTGTGDQSDSQPRRSQRMRKARRLFASEAHYALLTGQEEHEPLTLTDALSCNEREKWKAACESELTSLAQNNTWVIEPLPEGRSAIGCRWLFKKKEDGRYKARLVAKGYSQQHRIDYEETFAPVAKFTTIRVLLALSCENEWEVEGMDVKTAFLNGELEEQL